MWVWQTKKFDNIGPYDIMRYFLGHTQLLDCTIGCAMDKNMFIKLNLASKYFLVQSSLKYSFLFTFLSQ